MKFVTLTAAGALFAGAAYAGGIAPAPVEPVPMAPAPLVMPVQDWTGGYVGASLGYARGDADLGGLSIDADGDGDFGDDDDDDLVAAFSDVFGDIDADGAIGGVFAGYQHDFGNFVLGAELDLNATGISGDDQIITGPDTDGDGLDEEYNIEGLDIDQVHRLKLRAGYDLGNTLVYGTVGAAYAKAEFNEEEFEGVGGVIGAGVDYKVTDNVVVGAEVLYHRFDDFDDTGLEADATSIAGRVAYQF
ncbi:Opacity protein [Palleronia marisminoris]|uniref:Outer membrane protein beta-barrel domain-containing protein n=1 Tax=Palleronia marisminoris TaxID=315423 RepID=A0A1Y5TG47_9RHOB|nr:outer membrane beta-barrel protein [Palleronia marisminoris]SFH37981.1 Opacity protein [Palleronia marisminoris]SLN62944.1 hypothetical protein PAM7066_03149 [Palleronia marisminoris]